MPLKSTSYGFWKQLLPMTASFSIYCQNWLNGYQGTPKWISWCQRYSSLPLTDSSPTSSLLIRVTYPCQGSESLLDFWPLGTKNPKCPGGSCNLEFNGTLCDLWEDFPFRELGLLNAQSSVLQKWKQELHKKVTESDGKWSFLDTHILPTGDAAPSKGNLGCTDEILHT